MYHELQNSELDKMVKTMSKFAKQNGYTGSIDRDSVRDFIKSCAESMGDILGDYLDKCYEFAVKQYGFYESPETKHFEENYWLIVDNIENILSVLNIYVDYPGLYPNFTIVRDNRSVSDHSVKNSIRWVNNFWRVW